MAIRLMPLLAAHAALSTCAEFLVPCAAPSGSFCGGDGLTQLCPLGSFCVGGETGSVSCWPATACAVTGLAEQPPCFWRTSTLAGSGAAAWADGQGTAAAFNRPDRIAIDAVSGSYVIADVGNNRLRIVTPNGAVSTLAGSGAGAWADGVGTEASFHSPLGIAFNATGVLFVADYDNNRVRVVSRTGAVTSLAGNGVAGWVDGGGTDASFNRPSGIAVNSSGDVFVTDKFNNRVRSMTPLGFVSTFAGSGATGWADGVGTSAILFNPNGITTDAANVAIWPDMNSNRIRKATPQGVVTTIAGGGSAGTADGLGTVALFNEPKTIAVFGSGLLVADGYNHLIRLIDKEGNVTTIAGSGVSGWADGWGRKAVFNITHGLAVDVQGNVVIGEEGGNRIRAMSCVPCPASYYCSYGTPITCPAGSYCPLSSIHPTPCSAGTFNPSTGASNASACSACTSGGYCPTGAAAPIPCNATCLCPLSSSSSCPAPIPFPMFASGPQHMGRSAYSAPTAALSFSTFKHDGSVITSPLAVGPTGGVTPSFFSGMLFAGCTGAFLGLNSLTGAVLEAFAIPSTISVTTTPAMGPWGYVYVGGSDGTLYAFDYSRSGPPLWTFLTGSAVISPPTVCSSTQTLFFGSDDKSIHAVHALNGSALWSTPTGGVVHSSPVLDAACTTVYVGSSDLTFYALSAATGSLLWKYVTVAPITSSPSVSADGSLVFVGVSSSINLIAFDIATQQPVWEVPAEEGGGVIASPAISADGTVFVGTRSGLFFASTSSAPLNIEWSVQLDGPVSASATIGADGTLYVGTEAGTLYALCPSNGSKLWSLPLGEPISTAAVIAADGRLFLPSLKSPALFVVAATPLVPSTGPGPIPPGSGGSSSTSTALSGGLIGAIAGGSAAVLLLGALVVTAWRSGCSVTTPRRGVEHHSVIGINDKAPLLASE